MYRKRLWMVSILFFLIFKISSAQESKLYTPQPEHALLKRFAGEWQFEKKSIPADDQSPQNLGTGEIKAELLGSFFVVCRWSGNIYGTNYDAVQTLGYDVDKKEFSGFWVDSIMSYQWQFNGSLISKDNKLVISASGPAPNGNVTQFRESYQFHSADSISILAEIFQDDKWVPLMTTQLTRKKKPKQPKALRKSK